MTTKGMKRGLLLSALALCLCFVLLLGTTFAWFTSSVTSSNNIIKAGNLDVEMYWAKGTEDPASANWADASEGAIFNYTLWEPGYVEVRHIKIENVGSLALKYQVNIVANGNVSDLADVIDVYYADPAVQVADRAALTDENKLGTLAEVLAGLGESGNGTLAAGASETITIALKMQETAGNAYMLKSIGSTFSVQLLATQYTVEEDSFDDQYDKDATYADVTVDSIGGGEDITAGTVTVTLPDNAEEATYTLEVTNKTMQTNDAGETTLSLDINLLKGDAKAGAGSYTVVIDIGTAIPAGVTHNGVAVDNYTYDLSTGLITFTTDSFSPFAISYFAETTAINSAADLIDALTEIKASAKQQIPGENGNKAYRENAIFVLENDIVIDSGEQFTYTDSNGAALHFYGVKGVLDLNGHSITVTADALLSGKSYANAVLLIQYSDIDIIGEGSIVAENKSIPVYGWANSTVNIYGGNYVTNASERNESAVYVNNATVMINVYGGTYTGSAYAFNVHDNCKTTTTIVLHEGITFADFLKNGTTDVFASDLNNGRIALADGCELAEVEESLNKVVKN